MRHLILIIQYILKPLKVDTGHYKEKLQHYFNKFEHLNFQWKVSGMPEEVRPPQCLQTTAEWFSSCQN